MICPYCQADNLEKRDTCYNCGKDITMLRTIVNKARHHYNIGLEHAERQRYNEAIIELNNCLELDKSFLNAYVVLGTIHAKLGDEETARELWEKALSLDSSVLKAHQYLEKLKVVHERGPWRKNARYLLLVPSMVLLIALAVVGYLLLPDIEYRQFDNGIEQYTNREYAAAIDTLSGVENSWRHRNLESRSEELIRLIRERIENKMTMIQMAQQNGNYAEAIESIEELKQSNPPVHYLNKLDSLQSSIENNLRSRLEQSLAAYESDRITSASLIQDLSAYEALFDDPQSQQLAAEVREKFYALRFERRLEKLYDEYKREQNYYYTLDRLRELSQDYPQHERLLEMRRAIREDLIRSKLSEFAAALERKDVSVMRALREDLLNWTPYIEEERAKEIAAGWDEAIDQFKAENLLQQLNELSFKDVPELKELSQTLKQSLSPQRWEDVQKQIEEMQKRFAKEIWEYLSLKRDWQFQRATISEEDARFTLQTYDFVLQHFDPTQLKWARDNLLYYKAVSHLKLGEREKARAMYEEMKEKFPDSRYTAFAENLLSDNEQ